MKRKIRQIQHRDGGTYAVADDGTWWWFDPLTSSWVQMPNLPDAPEPEDSRAEIRERAGLSSIARLKVKP